MGRSRRNRPPPKKKTHSAFIAVVIFCVLVGLASLLTMAFVINLYWFNNDIDVNVLIASIKSLLTL